MRSSSNRFCSCSRVFNCANNRLRWGGQFVYASKHARRLADTISRFEAINPIRDLISGALVTALIELNNSDSERAASRIIDTVHQMQASLATADDLVELCRVVARRGGIDVAIAPVEPDHLNALEQVVDQLAHARRLRR